MGVEGEILLNVSEETARGNRLATDLSERAGLAERLAKCVGEHVLHDCTGFVDKIAGGLVYTLIFRGGLQAYVKINADYFRFCGISEGDCFSCQVTTRGTRILNDSPTFQPAKKFSVDDLYSVRREKKIR